MDNNKYGGWVDPFGMPVQRSAAPAKKASSGGGWSNIVNQLSVAPWNRPGTSDAIGKIAADNLAGAAAPLGTYAGAAPEVPSEVDKLRGAITGNKDDIIRAYQEIFGEIDRLAKERSGQIEDTAGRNINELTGNYTASVPKIDASYAAVGAYDSTDKGDARKGADDAYTTAVDKVGKAKDEDLSKVGQYVQEQKGKYDADKSSILRSIGRVGETDNEGDLRGLRNEVENKLDTLGADKKSLGTDKGARGELEKITGDGGRFAAIKGSLDNIMQSSLSGEVKSAAVQQVLNSGDVSEEDKQKVKQQYGDAYSAQAAA